MAVLMADQKRHGELIYSDRGYFKDMENGDRGYHALTKRMVEVGNAGREEGWSVTSVFQKMAESIEGKGQKESGKAETEEKGAGVNGV